MEWRGSRAESRRRYVSTFDMAEVERYDSLRGLGTLETEDQAAYLTDIARHCEFRPGMTVLDVGAGTGVLCLLLQQLGSLRLTALEPAPAMLAKLCGKPALQNVECKAGFCDGEDDPALFAEGRFDKIASRQLVNGLFEPLTAFRNWHHCLAPGGTVLVSDGLYCRSGWTGPWALEVDVLPASACETMALTPYLLEASGFDIEAVELMEATNQLACTRTPRYLVVATKGAGS